jgi:Rad3-related DNA helicase
MSEEQEETTLTLFCLDPSKQIKQTLDKIRTVICFSATLSPLTYFLPMLGSVEGDSILKLASPFPSKHFSVMIPASLSTTFKNRDKTIPDIAQYLTALIEGKVGNYLFFFPSYKYLEDVKQKFVAADINIIYQHKDMLLEEKENFLASFTSQPEKTTVGFAVLGGIFSEGIDLIADRLIGVAIISVGLPQLSFTRDLIAAYYSKQGKHGFQFAYVYPAINKVLQAMGRVIRSETDQGVALLLDERFLQSDYQDIVDKYRQYQIIYSPKDVSTIVYRFFVKD